MASAELCSDGESLLNALRIALQSSSFRTVNFTSPAVFTSLEKRCKTGLMTSSTEILRNVVDGARRPPVG